MIKNFEECFPLFSSLCKHIVHDHGSLRFQSPMIHNNQMNQHGCHNKVLTHTFLFLPYGPPTFDNSEDRNPNYSPRLSLPGQRHYLEIENIEIVHCHG